MKLAVRLTWTIIAGLCLILAADGLWRIHAIGQRLRDDMRHDHQLIGRSAGRAVAEAPKVHDWKEALADIERTFEHTDAIHIRWVANVPPAGSGVHAERFYSYVPLPADSTIPGFIEVSESLHEERAYMHAAILRVVGVTLAMALLAAGLAAILGYRIVGSPVRTLVNKARRVGQGELGDPLKLGKRDELSDLAQEMNLMCERLAEANARVADETRTRIAALEALRHADRLATVGKLASGMAHELGTPLNVIAARAKMIELGEGSPAELADYGRIVGEQTERITRIVRHLLDFARGGTATAASDGPARQAVDLRLLANEVCRMLRPLAGKRGITLTVQGGNPVDRALADRNLIDHALTNLVINAIQASGQDGMVTIDIGAKRVVPPPEIGGPEARYASLTVRDQGTGIDSELLPHIFEPFFTTKEVGQGTGLGLSVAYGTVHEHGGWITVESEPGQGSCFTIFLPAKM